MSLVPYKNYAKVLRASEAGNKSLPEQLATVNTFAWRSDPGGWSYGAYQLATFGHRIGPGPVILGPKSNEDLLRSKSPFHGFLEWGLHLNNTMSTELAAYLSPGKAVNLNDLALEAAGVGGGRYIDNSSFRNRWVKFAHERTDLSEELQSGYHARSYYWPIHAMFKKYGIDLLQRGEGINQLVTDYANVGPGHFQNAIKAIAPLHTDTDKQLIEKFGDYYADLFDKFGRAQPKFAKGWENRFGSKINGTVGKVEKECLKLVEGK